MLGNDWDELLKNEMEKEYFQKLFDFIKEQYREKDIYPKMNEIFNAFRHTSYKNVKVVILGQDPYHGENEAEGLSFSVKVGIRKPPSLNNIFKELKDDLGYEYPKSGSLVKWADEGVLLLNSVLTVEKDKPASHRGRGWELFTDTVIKKINEKNTPVVFILWGNYATAKKDLITNPNHLVLESTHPSPYSASSGFFGSRPFSKTNNYLKSKGIKPIDWNLSK